MTDFADAAESVRDLRGDLTYEHERVTEASMKDVTDAAQRKLRANDSIARGQAGGLISRLSTRRPVASEHRITYATVAPKPAIYVEYGTGPRGDDSKKTKPSPSVLPPFEPIHEWVLDKDIDPRDYDSTYGLAQAIRETIQAVGTHAHPFLRPTWRGYGKSHVSAENRKAMRRAVRRNF